jgi:hypothetical protein
MLIYTRKLACEPSPFFACFCGAAIGIALAASPTFFFNSLLQGDTDQ